MALPWVRLDANIASHDKILNLLADPSPKRYQAAFSYVSALGWCGGHGTDGRVTHVALPMVHGTTATARLLVKYGLWVEAPGGYDIPNFPMRQELSAITAGRRAAQSAGALKANCRRWHGPECWREGAGCTRDAA